MSTLKEIEGKTLKYADARSALAASLAALEDELRQVKRKYLAGIKRQVATAKEARERLHEAVAESPELFVKPRTVTVHGIKVGFQKGKGEIEFDDVDQVVKLIRKHHPDQFDVLVKTSHKPIKKALANLPAADLKKLGIQVAETGDEVVIKDAAGEVDKLVEALLAEEIEE